MTSATLKRALFEGCFTPQVPEDSFALCEILMKRPLKKILEIGTGLGSTPIWEFLLEGSGLVVSVDINQVAIDLVAPIVNPDLVKCIRGDAASVETFEKIKRYFDLGTVDFLFIDGEHVYEYVKADYERNRPFVRDGGIIGFHDTKFDGPGRVMREAEEQGLHTFEVPAALGIGLIFVGEEAS